MCLHCIALGIHGGRGLYCWREVNKDYWQNWRKTQGQTPTYSLAASARCPLIGAYMHLQIQPGDATRSLNIQGNLRQLLLSQTFTDAQRLCQSSATRQKETVAPTVCNSTHVQLPWNRCALGLLRSGYITRPAMAVNTPHSSSSSRRHHRTLSLFPHSIFI